MYCKNCGNKLNENQIFCNLCGTKVEGEINYNIKKNENDNNLQTVSNFEQKQKTEQNYEVNKDVNNTSFNSKKENIISVISVLISSFGILLFAFLTIIMMNANEENVGIGYLWTFGGYFICIPMVISGAVIALTQVKKYKLLLKNNLIICKFRKIMNSIHYVIIVLGIVGILIMLLPFLWSFIMMFYI